MQSLPVRIVTCSAFLDRSGHYEDADVLDRVLVRLAQGIPGHSLTNLNLDMKQRMYPFDDSEYKRKNKIRLEQPQFIPPEYRKLPGTGEDDSLWDDDGPTLEGVNDLDDSHIPHQSGPTLIGDDETEEAGGPHEHSHEHKSIFRINNEEDDVPGPAYVDPDPVSPSLKGDVKDFEWDKKRGDGVPTYKRNFLF